MCMSRIGSMVQTKLLGRECDPDIHPRKDEGRSQVMCPPLPLAGLACETS